MLKDHDKMIRRRAIIALANIGIKTDVVITSIQKLLADEEAEVRDYAKQALEVLQK
jgi:HEAT repeat protein